MNIDYDSLSKDELKALIRNAEKALKTLDERRKAEAKRAAESAAREYGFSLDDLLGSSGKKGTKGVPKYRNPADASQTWTGKGRQPNWIKQALSSGKSLDDLKI